MYTAAQNHKSRSYSSAPVTAGNTFQDLPQSRETADNTELYIYNVIFVLHI
jgi:hypothetical protein